MKKAKVLSIILAAIMVFAMLPQCALAAADTAALDAALGKLADKGQNYVTDGALPNSVTIEETLYTVNYASSNEAVITSAGVVNHGLTVEYVTVTPQIEVADAVVQGTAQSLIVMPSGTVALEEDFEGADFAFEEGATSKALTSGSTYNGWSTAFVANSTINVLKNGDSNYLELRTGSSSSSSAPTISKSFTEKTTGITVMAFKSSFSLYRSGREIRFSPLGRIYMPTASPKTYIFSGGTQTSGTSTLGDSSAWAEYVLVRYNNATPSLIKTEVFKNGTSIGTFEGSYDNAATASTFLINMSRLENGYFSIDDILVMDVPLPDVKIADIGKYVISDALPASAAGCSLTYECSDPTVITANGVVNHGLSVKFVTVTPKLNVGGSVISLPAQELAVMPSGTVKVSEDFEGDAFKPETGATEKVLSSASTYNDWTVNTATGTTVKTVDDATRSRYLSMRVDDYTKGVSPTITKSMSTLPESGISILAFSGYFSIPRNRTYGHIYMKPFVGLFTSVAYSGYTISADGSLDAQADNEADRGGLYITQSSWNDYVLVRKNSANASEVVTEVFMNGSSIGTFTGDGGFNKDSLEIFLEHGRYNGNTMYIDNIIAMDVTVDVDSIKLADKGNSYVVGNELPKTVTIDGIAGTITYESTNPDVIDNEGNVTHGDSFAYVDVTPTVTILGNQYTGKAQKLLVMPASYDEALFEDFESFNTGSLIDNDKFASNGWMLGNTYNANAFGIDIVNDAEHGNYFQLENKAAAANEGANVIFYKNFEPRESGLTYIAFRAKLHTPGASKSTGASVYPASMFSNGNSWDGVGAYGAIYTEDTWHDFLFVVDNSLSAANINADEVKKFATVYVDGELKDRSHYLYDWDTYIRIESYRKLQHIIEVDDIVVAHVDSSDYIVTDVKQSNTALNGFTVTKMNPTAANAKAYAAIYDANGKLTASNAFTLDFTGNEAVVSGKNVSFNGGTTMKLFVWTDALSPVALVTERALVTSKPTIYIIGDSTVANNGSTNSKKGWGIYIQNEFAADSVVIGNNAVSGERADDFMSEYFPLVNANMKNGDVLLIQFGNNDQSYYTETTIEGYQGYLRQYVNAARNKGAYPVLVSPPHRLNDSLTDMDTAANADGETLQDFADAMETVATEMGVPFINTRPAMKAVYDEQGFDAFKAFFTDTQHFNEAGAQFVAGVVADGLKTALPAAYASKIN